MFKRLHQSGKSVIVIFIHMLFFSNVHATNDSEYVEVYGQITSTADNLVPYAKIMFIAHGLQKAFGMFGGYGIDGFSKMLEGLGFSPATPLAYIVAYIELIGGICLILGLLTRIASVLLMGVIVVAAIKVHLPNGFFMMAGGYEYNFIITSALIALLISGSGKIGITKNL